MPAFRNAKNTFYETPKGVTKAFLGRYVTQANQQLQHLGLQKCCNDLKHKAQYLQQLK